MPTLAYDEIVSHVRELSSIDLLNLMEELMSVIRVRIQPEERVSILELEGLGAELWKGIDAQEYVNQERDSWNG